MNEPTEDEIEWDHPLCRSGVVHEALIREAFQINESHWPKWCGQHKRLFRTINGERWFSMRSIEAWVSEGEER